MPNHVHGIIVITGRGTAGRSQMTDMETDRRAPTHNRKFGIHLRDFIPTIVRSYKSSVALRVNYMRGSPGAQVWQQIMGAPYPG